MKVAFVLVLLALAATGCMTRSRAQAQARAQAQQAYLAGQNATLLQLQQMESAGTGVTILGPVQNSQVPWVAGLTLAQAVATANYLDSNGPREIIITRQGESATLDPKVLLNGAVVPLEAGDVVELRP